MTSMINRRAFLGRLAGGLLAAPLAAAAQQAGRGYRIGVLMDKASDPAESRQLQVFRLGLQGRGSIEGENILIQLRQADGKSPPRSQIAGDLVARTVHLIATPGPL